ncbi:MAG TPA: Hsp20/alpha crystallin family protein [Methanobacterium sp.]|jgi:HSP20 family protein|nr:MAG: Hsp20/alpha crystallin family protein [Methanobacterium sp.]HOI71286.1 Hsp20/alpha crystallin family protein [Methanobacterium sp.]HPX77251.1 Hsp20/alpha crystallin family protein [Methanobacterium sp.]
MVDKKNLEVVQGTGADEGTSKAQLGKKTESKASTSNETRSLRKDAEDDVPKGRTQAEKMFNDFVSTIRDRQEDFSKAISDYTSSLQKPLADVLDSDTEIIIKADLPGAKKELLNVTLTETSVEITATFDEEYKEEEVNYIRRERNYGKITKTIELPAKIDVKKASAKFEDSILTINLPKIAAEKIKIDIK